jgi:hypothetical protein
MLMSLIAENITVGGVGIFSGLASIASFREKSVASFKFGICARVRTYSLHGNFVSILFRRVRKIRKDVGCFVMSLFVRPHGTNRHPLDGFS